MSSGQSSAAIQSGRGERMKGIKSELLFLLELWKTNLSSAMEYRASFISQVVGMIINDAIYFVLAGVL